MNLVQRAGRKAKRIIRKTPLYARYHKKAQFEKLVHFGYRRINFGCGQCPLKGWTNIDGGDGGAQYQAPDLPEVVQLDVWDALAAIPDGQTEFITSEQFIEHFDRWEGRRMLGEWLRILKPGGVVRMQTPDLQNEVKMYRHEIPDIGWEEDILPHRLRMLRSEQCFRLIEGEEYTPAMLLNNGMRMDGHKFLYDFATLAQSLRLAGFINPVRCAFGRSEHEALRGIDKHDGGETGRHWIPKIVLTVEATKPGRPLAAAG